MAALPVRAEIKLLAHRGLAQQFDRTRIDHSTCTAARMLPPTHDFLENTIASIAAAFDHGAYRVEIDVHPTRDGDFVVFHDWTLDCRTNGTGVTREQDLAYLKSLDIGHGYTADGGATFPFRGGFVGAMPTWADVMRWFPGKRFLVNIKSNDPIEGLLATEYAYDRDFDLRLLAFSGGDQPIATIREKRPEVRTLSKSQLKSCVFGYLVLGWLGHVPQACRNAIIYVPINHVHLLAGWPHRFVERMEGVGSEVYLIGPYTAQTEESGITGIDTPEALPAGYRGGVMTDRIEKWHYPDS